jgi:UDP-N-acetylglucosamine 4,6-dehydratase
MKNKMLIFGGSGSLGNELVKFYIDQYKIVVASRGEEKLWKLVNTFKSENLSTLICDVREEKRVESVLLQEKPDIIIIAQALKQVDICEKFPMESVNTNILGVANIVQTLKKLKQMGLYSPKLVCFVSTDKACLPITIYGMCKSISEKLVLDLSQCFDGFYSRAVIVRYGNVLSSAGSIIPLLIKQGEDKNYTHFSLTNELMTRFIMTLADAVKLIDTTLKDGNNGDLWVPKLKSMKIEDLMKYFGKIYNKPYKITGLRLIEKIHEAMLSMEEAIHVNIVQDYFVFNQRNPITNNLNKEYSSADYLLTEKELTSFMDEYLANK